MSLRPEWSHVPDLALCIVIGGTLHLSHNSHNSSRVGLHVISLLFLLLANSK